VLGAIQGFALDIHRGSLSTSKIDAATAQLLISLGVEAAEASHLAFAPITAPPETEFPMRWLALPPKPLSLTGT
jgi:hypothetical protein